MSQQTLSGKTAVITGGGSGIGAGIALTFARAGANIVICGRRAEPLARIVKLIEQDKGNAKAVIADVSLVEDVERVVATAVSAFGDIDILVNNAAVDGGGPIHSHSIADWDRIMAINLRGPFLCSRAVLPMMRARQSGHILNISSESALEHYPGNGAYGVSKHALNALGEYIQAENQAHNIRVDTLCPGMVVTEMSQDIPGLDHGKCLLPDDVAELALWLVSRRANIKIGRPVLIQTMLNPWT